MKVLFAKTSLGTSSISFFDMGIGSMSAVLKAKGHQTKFFFIDSQADIERFIQRIELLVPDIVAFSATETSFPFVNEISKRIKKKYPKLMIVCGGVFVTLNPSILEKASWVDGICLGEGEEALSELVESRSNKGRKYLKTPGWWFRDGKNIIKNKLRVGVVDINKLPFPDREIFLEDGSLFWRGTDRPGKGVEFIFSRGCPFNCSYCSNHALNEFYKWKYVRFKDPALVMAEIEDVMARYRYDYFVFHDDTFTVNREWLLTFLKMYQRIKVPFECNVRVDTVDKEVLELLKKAGCYLVRIGVESGDEKIRKTILKKNITNEQIEKAVKLARNVGIAVDASVMIGFPGETKQSFLRTTSLMAKIKADFDVLYVFYPYQGTQLYKECLRDGYLGKDRRKILEERRDTVLNMPNFPPEEILNLYKNYETLVRLSDSGGSWLANLHKKYLLVLKTQKPGTLQYRVSEKLWNLEQRIKSLVKH